LDASGVEEERPESAEEPVTPRQAGRPPATTTKHEELLLEHEILCDHRSHATGATQLRGHDGEVEQGEQEDQQDIRSLCLSVPRLVNDTDDGQKDGGRG